MKIGGLQKTTLIDYPGKIACTIFLYGCNFKCGFCYNAELVTKKPESLYSIDEILNFLKKRKDKLEGVCITGGEPLISLQEDFLKSIKELGYLIKIDTNGTNPDKLKELLNKGLVDFVAMDIKGVKEDYSKIANKDVDIQKIEESIKIISCLDNYEFRTTVLSEFHNKENIREIAEWLNKLAGKKPKAYFLQGFKNKGDFIDKKYKNVESTKEGYLKEIKKEIIPFFEKVEIRW